MIPFINIFLNTLCLMGIFTITSMTAKLIMLAYFSRFCAPSNDGPMGLSWSGGVAVAYGLGFAWVAARFMPWF